MAELGVFVGGLIPTFLISRLFLWLLRQWAGGAARLVTVNAASLLLVSFIAGMGMADAGAFAGMRALTIYGLPQGLWLMIDLIRFANRRETAPSAPAPKEQTENAMLATETNASKDSAPSEMGQIASFSASILLVVLIGAGIIWIGTRHNGQAPSYSWEQSQAVSPADCANEIQHLNAAGYTQFNPFACFVAQDTSTTTDANAPNPSP